MITGHVATDGIPRIEFELTGRTWPAIVDTGFNGDLELPEVLRPEVNARFKGRSHALLAGGQTVAEDTFQVDFPFDGRIISAEATFAAGNEILVGTGLLRQYRLTIDFPAGRVELQRLAPQEA